MVKTNVEPNNQHEIQETQQRRLLNQLHDFLASLDENYKIPYEMMQKEIDTHKAVVDNINALIVVCAFIAGVQAQMISFTFESNGTVIQIATNWFSFVGLILDILGTSIGAIRVLSLQNSIRQSEGLLRKMTESLDRLRQSINRLKDQRASTTPENREQTVERIVSQLHAHANMLSEFQRFHDFSFSPLDAVFDILSLIAPGPYFVFRSLELFVRLPTTMPNQVPLIAMGGGILCLLISIILFAVSSQLKSVWIACIIMTGWTIIWVVLTPAFDGKRRERMRSRANIEGYLAQSTGQ